MKHGTRQLGTVFLLLMLFLCPIFNGLAESLRVDAIYFQKPTPETEKICVQFSDSLVPDVFPLEGDRPRIVLDIEGISDWYGNEEIPTDGRFVQQVRTHLHRETETLRIVIDLDPELDFTANPIYYDQENLYCLEIRKAE